MGKAKHKPAQAHGTEAEMALRQHGHADHVLDPEAAALLPEAYLVRYRRPALPFGGSQEGPEQAFLSDEGRAAFFHARVRQYHEDQAEAAANAEAAAEVEAREFEFRSALAEADQATL